ncbi:hypothetical protein MIMGU_mgv1a017264mg [Erythranthe guttata]|uniref:Uncharacterized protein n=1 Tax=Erythranthe guttata TaxID=4155 RepID=A0A022QKD9_ERYGU|nr:hypothetical protein MIMGU_mgv1a017264mg [Erythranthe guttata]
MCVYSITSHAFINSLQTGTTADHTSIHIRQVHRSFTTFAQAGEVCVRDSTFDNQTRVSRIETQPLSYYNTSSPPFDFSLTIRSPLK